MQDLTEKCSQLNKDTDVGFIVRLESKWLLAETNEV
jgi:hypothetical protein